MGGGEGRQIGGEHAGNWSRAKPGHMTVGGRSDPGEEEALLPPGEHSRAYTFLRGPQLAFRPHLPFE